MRTKNVQLYAAAQTATGSAIASTIVQRPALIVGVLWNLLFTTNPGNASLRFELSLQSLLQGNVSDIPGSIISIATASSVITTSGALSQTNLVDVGMAVPVAAGDRVYLHTAYVAGTISVIPLVLIRFSE